MAEKPTTTSTQDGFTTWVKYVADQDDAYRMALAQQLKKAKLWTGKVTPNMDSRFYNALGKLEAKYKEQIAVYKAIGDTRKVQRYDILQLAIEDATSGGASSGPTTTTSKYITSASQTAKILQPIAEDLLGRRLNKAEIAKYTKLINVQQEKQPTVTTSGKGFSNTTGGIDEQQFIEEKLSGTADAKTKLANDAYSVLMEELGGLR